MGESVISIIIIISEIRTWQIHNLFFIFIIDSRYLLRGHLNLALLVSFHSKKQKYNPIKLIY